MEKKKDTMLASIVKDAFVMSATLMKNLEENVEVEYYLMIKLDFCNKFQANILIIFNRIVNS